MMTPEYENISDIIVSVWDYCMELEDEYHRTGDSSILAQFAVAIMVVQYWEDVYLNMEGLDAYTIHF